MFGIRAMELVFMLTMFGVFAVGVGGVIYIAVRLAIKHERKNSG
jgi:hypothetical protein